MEILQLRYFFDTAKSESISKTAEKYGVPASGVSASIKRLEQELGCKLFDRSANRIVLNEDGKRFQTSLSVVLSELDHAVAGLGAEQQETVNIKLLVRTYRGTMTRHMIDFYKQHPTVRFDCVFDFDDTELDRYDIIIDRAGDEYADFEKHELASPRLCMRVAENHPLAGRTVSLRQLRHEAFVTMGENSNMHRVLVRACKNAGFEPRVVCCVNDTGCYKQCVQSGMGIGLFKPTDTEAMPGFTLLDITDFNERQAIYVYYKRSAPESILRFVSYLKDQANR